MIAKSLPSDSIRAEACFQKDLPNKKSWGHRRTGAPWSKL